MAQFYKSVSYPKSMNKSSTTRVLKLAVSESDNELIQIIKDLDSSQMRVLLNDHSIEQLEQRAQYENRSLNNTCLLMIKENLARYNVQNRNQLNLFFSNPFNGLKITKKSGTFRNNKQQGIFNWYPYVEGFSYDFVEEILEYVTLKPNFIYDPFAGTGTTILVASQKGIPSGFSEINPLMEFIITTKVNSLINFNKDPHYYEQLILAVLNKIETTKSLSLDDGLKKKYSHLLNKKYFDSTMLHQLILIKEIILENCFDTLVRNLLLLALSAIIVKESNMIRRADLRYKRDKEYADIEPDVTGLFCSKALAMLKDLKQSRKMKFASANKISNNAKEIDEKFFGSFDLIITSPPYLNGTNYFRNTKLELLFLDFIETEEDLKNFRTQAISSGINNISSRNRNPIQMDYVEPFALELEKDNYDVRIPRLIRAYFSDMKIVFENIYNCLTTNGDFFIDIGDSKFGKVHIPTDEIFIKIADDVGLELIDQKFIRARYSKDGTPLKQVLLNFKRKTAYIRKNTTVDRLTQSNFIISQSSSAADLVKKNWQVFRDALPYRHHPYSKRNWGNGFHSLCSYQGKLKPAIAHFLIKFFTNEKMKVLDPLCGVGTIPFEACLQGRVGYANDLSKVAYGITRAKISRKNVTESFALINQLEKYIQQNAPAESVIENIDVDFNRNLKEYYHPETLKEIVAARDFFQKKTTLTGSEAVVFSSLLHILHGNRPYALSRTSHPITPFAPKGEFVYKNLIYKLKEKVTRTYQIELPENFVVGTTYHSDFLNLQQFIPQETLDSIITSPPFFDSTRFYLANWIRMWFAGWDKEDFHREKEKYLETKQMKNLDIYDDFFKICFNLLKREGSLIMHLGFSKKANMSELLIPYAEKYFKVIGYFNENVSNNEKFGISDQGTVKIHQFLFMVKE